MKWIRKIFTKDRQQGVVENIVKEKPQKHFDVVLPSNKRGRGRFDINSPTWAYIERHCEKKLDIIRKKNDTMGLSLEKTENMRGRIYEIKKLLQLPEHVRKENEDLNRH